VTVAVGDSMVRFNKEATRWLGVWLDSQLTLKDHHAIRMKSGRKVMTRLRRLTGQMGLSPAYCRKVMTACFQSVAMFGAVLWWKGDLAEGTIGRTKELQLLVNQEARATTGCFRTTNLGALSMESRLRAATAQLENRQRRFGLRLLSLPEGDQAREVVGAPSEIGRRLKNALAYCEQTERTVLLEEPETLDAELLQEEEAEARAAAEGPDQASPCSRTDHDWTTERPGTRWCGKRAKPGRGSKFTWATTKKPTTPSALRSPAPWSWRRNGTRPRNESPSFRIPFSTRTTKWATCPRRLRWSAWQRACNQQAWHARPFPAS